MSHAGQLLTSSPSRGSRATAYYRDQSSKVAERFLDGVARAIELLEQFPRIGAPMGNNARRIILKTYPYQFIYRIEGDDIRVYAVAHLKRKPGYWRQRLREQQ